MDVRETFGSRLRGLRGATNQKELADALGISRASLGYYENATRTPDIEILEKVSKHFGVSYDYLMGESDSKVKENHDVMEVTGLSEKAIEKLKQMNKNDKINWQMITFNHLMACEKFEYLIAVITDYAMVDETSVIESVPITGEIHVPEPMKRKDVYSLQMQNTLNAISDEIRVSLGTDAMKLKFHYKTWYSTYTSLYNDGRMDKETYERIIVALDNCDSDALKGWV